MLRGPRFNGFGRGPLNPGNGGKPGGGRGDWGLRRLAASAAAGGTGGGAPGGGGVSGAQQMPPHMRAMLVKALKITGAVALTAGVTVAALPLLLATPTGTQALVAALNAAQPGHVEVGSVEVALGGVRHASLTLREVRVSEPKAWGGATLLHAPEILCQGTPWQLYTLSPSSITLRHPTIHGGYDAAAHDFKVVRFLEGAGVLAAPEPPPAEQAEADLADKRAQDEANRRRADQRVGTGGKGVGALAANAPSGPPPSDLLHPSSASHPQPQQPPQHQHQHQQGSTTWEHTQPQQQQQQPQQEEVGAFMRALTDCASEVECSVDVRTPDLHLVVEDASLVVSRDMRDILGGYVHLQGAVGARQLEWLYADGTTTPTGGHEKEYLHQQHQQNQKRHQSLSGDAPPPSSSSQAGHMAATSPEAGTRHRAAPPLLDADVWRPGEGVGVGSPVCDAMAPGRWWEGMPPHPDSADKVAQAVCDKGVHGCTPGEWRVRAPHLDTRARVWEVVTDPGSDQPGPTLLHEPARMAVRLTPALSRWGLAAVAPVLGVVAGLSEAGSEGVVWGTWAPEGMSLPYTDAHVIMAPMKLRLEASSVVSQLMETLHIPGLHKAFKQARRAQQEHQKQLARQQQQQQRQAADDSADGQGEPGQAGGSDWDLEWGSTASSVAGGGGGGGGGGGVGLLEAWVSGMRVDLKRSGAIHQRRVDMLIGPPGLTTAQDGLYLALWGSANPDTDQLRMTVGLPGPTLARLGVHEADLPPGYCLPIPLGGTISSPQLQVRGVAARAAQLVVSQAGQRVARRRGAEATEGGQEAAGDGGGKESGSGSESEDGSRDPHPHSKPGVGGAAKAAASWVVKKGVGWLLESLAPGGSTGRRIWEQMECDARVVPVQEQPVPWLEPGSDGHSADGTSEGSL